MRYKRMMGQLAVIRHVSYGSVQAAAFPVNYKEQRAHTTYLQFLTMYVYGIFHGPYGRPSGIQT